MQTPPELPPMRSTPPPQTAPAPLQSGAAAAKRAPVGAGRLRQIVTMLAGGGFIITAGIGGLQMVAKPGLRPSDFVAAIEAQTELSITNQKLGHAPGEMVVTETDYREKLAEAERRGQARAELGFQRQLAVVQADKERVVAAYQTLYQRANIIAQAALQMEQVAQQFRQQLLTMSNGGRATVIAIQDMLCAVGSQPACEAAKAARAGMIAEADALSRGDVGAHVRELMAGIDDPASFVTHEDQRRHGTPALDR